MVAAHPVPVRWFGRLLRALILLGVLAVIMVAALLLAYRIFPPISTLMAARMLLGKPVDRVYVPVERMSPTLIASVISAEDGRFCEHHGVDWSALHDVIADADEDGPARGASTIAMQTAKNLFLWPSRSYVRKGLEIPLALLIDAAWPKRRVIEVYLNIVELGPGIFGVEAAARRYFNKSAADLTAREAALIATSLPNPLKRNAARPGRGHARLASLIQARAAGTRLDCLDSQAVR